MHAQLKADKALALKHFNNADSGGKKMLTAIFGATAFLPITDRIKTFEDACEDQGLDPIAELAPYANVPEGFRRHIVALVRLTIIARSLREGWVPDWNDQSEYKYYAWFYLNKPAFRLDGVRYANSSTRSTGGSRLCMPTEELMNYFATQFLGEFENLMTE